MALSLSVSGDARQRQPVDGLNKAPLALTAGERWVEKGKAAACIIHSPRRDDDAMQRTGTDDDDDDGGNVMCKQPVPLSPGDNLFIGFPQGGEEGGRTRG